MSKFLCIAQIILRRHRVLMLASYIDVKRRYAGTIFGLLWVVLYPLSFLAIYSFVYLVVLKVKFPDFSSVEYVLYVFSGLVPYVSLIDSVSRSSSCIRQNMNLVTNSILPLELIPARPVLVAMLGQLIGLVFLLILAISTGNLSLKLLALPFAMVMFAIFVLGISYFVAIVGVFLPDIEQVIGLFLLLLMFLSPIAFQPEMVPDALQIIVYANPIYYVLEPYRWAVFEDYQLTMWNCLAAIIIPALTFLIGSRIFVQLRSQAIDNV